MPTFTPRIGRILSSFLTAPDDVQARAVLTQHPDLLAPDSLDLADAMLTILPIATEEGAKRALTRRAQLERASSIGIEHAFPRQPAPAAPVTPAPVAPPPPVEDRQPTAPVANAPATQGSNANDDKDLPSLLRGLMDELSRTNPSAREELERVLAEAVPVPPGPRCLQERVTVKCHWCDQPFDEEFWVIVDADERPDLGTRVEQGTIHDVVCPHCARALRPEIPLLFHAERVQELLLAAPTTTTADEDTATGKRLADHLVPRVPNFMTRGYFNRIRRMVGLWSLSDHLVGESRRSLSEPLAARCPSCGAVTATRYWAVVDAEERPDLVVQIRDGTIHNTTCATCGTQFDVDMPLLFHDETRQQLLLADPMWTDGNADQATNRRCVQHLFRSIPDFRSREYLRQTRHVQGLHGLQVELGAAPAGPRDLERLLSKMEQGQSSPSSKDKYTNSPGDEDPTATSLTKSLRAVLHGRAEGEQTPRCQTTRIPVPCRSCRTVYEAEIWEIVDAEERPDLDRMCHDGTIHQTTCPSCSTKNTPDAHMLYHDGRAETLVMVAPPTTPKEEDDEVCHRLILSLFPKVGGLTGKPYLHSAVGVPGLEGLRGFLTQHDGTRCLQEPVPTKCPSCSHAQVHDLWVLVDATERPDLADLCAKAALHEVVCVRCSRRFSPDSHVLFHDEEKKLLVLAAPLSTTSEQDRKANQRLHSYLLARMGKGVKRAYLETTRVTPGLAGLAVILGGGSDASEMNEAVRRLEERATESASDAIQAGRYHASEEHWDEAQSFFLRALELSERDNDVHGQIRALDALGDCARSCQHYDLSHRFYGKAVQLLPGCDDPDLKMMVLQDMGTTCMRMGRYAEAKQHFAQVEAMIDSTPDSTNAASALDQMGVLYSRLGETGKSEELYIRALAMARRVGNRGAEASIQGNLGALYSNRKEYEKAMEAFQKAIDAAKEVGDEEAEAATCNNIGVVYQNMGDPVQAEQYFRRAMEVHERRGALAHMASSLSNLGSLFGSRGDPVQALHHFERAVECAERSGAAEILADSLANIAITHRKLHNYDAASRFAQKARHLYHELGLQDREARMAMMIQILGLQQQLK